ncbi:DNA-binding protein [Streptomyces camponoticapitis]|uniref:DNA-binding protein n=1 Tax=Streptomyces camponoticapitis TaxID=1616125 RepID=A0ABQ2E5M5_9ACTN|nr:TraR/DksA C4-type zinc finger protein [Streptomyces camponoticapitis]GGJ95954.1 DNA-binding protein [Streptomyces camponoticapitis]
MVAKETAAKKKAAKKAAKKSAVKKSAAKKTAARKTSATKAPERETPATHAPDAEETAASEPEHQAPAKKTVARKTTPPKKVVAKKAAKEAASAAEGAAEAAEQTGAKTVAAKKTAGKGPTAAPGGTATAAPPVRGTTAAGELPVRPGEDPWTEAEVAEARAGLESEAARLNAEISSSEQALAGLMRDSGDGAGDDDADTGTKNITREHEMSLAANAREMVEQTERALLRLDAGTYGLCEVCGKPIGKARMQAFPRATLCVEDKQKQERRG